MARAWLLLLVSLCSLEHSRCALLRATTRANRQSQSPRRLERPLPAPGDPNVPSDCPTWSNDVEDLRRMGQRLFAAHRYQEGSNCFKIGNNNWLNQNLVKSFKRTREFFLRHPHAAIPLSPHMFDDVSEHQKQKELGALGDTVPTPQPPSQPLQVSWRSRWNKQDTLPVPGDDDIPVPPPEPSYPRQKVDNRPSRAGWPLQFWPSQDAKDLSAQEYRQQLQEQQRVWTSVPH